MSLPDIQPADFVIYHVQDINTTSSVLNNVVIYSSPCSSEPDKKVRG